VGKMPGRQIIVYDKAHEAIVTHKLFWFEVWGIDPGDSAIDVWRVELRAPKHELTRRWNIRTFDDVDRMIGDVYRNALEEIRYVLPDQSDSNVTRQELHPLWTAATETVTSCLWDFQSGVLPSRVREIERQLAIDTYSGLWLGNLAGWSVAIGMTDEEIETDLARRVHTVVDAAINDPRGKLQRSVTRARERLHFLAEVRTTRSRLDG
jgi:hypothetical protein